MVSMTRWSKHRMCVLFGGYVITIMGGLPDCDDILGGKALQIWTRCWLHLVECMGHLLYFIFIKLFFFKFPPRRFLEPSPPSQGTSGTPPSPRPAKRSETSSMPYNTTSRPPTLVPAATCAHVAWKLPTAWLQYICDAEFLYAMLPLEILITFVWIWFESLRCAPKLYFPWTVFPCYSRCQ